MDILKAAAVAVILICWTLKVFRDSIQFGKKGDSVYELWHCADLAIHAIHAILLTILLRLQWWGLLLCIAYGYLSYNFIYPLFRSIDVARLDDKIKFPRWLQALMQVKH